MTRAGLLLTLSSWFLQRHHLLVASSVLFCLFMAPTTVTAEEPSSVDERLLRMEQEIRSLHQRNQELEAELRALREKVESGEAAVSQPAAETAPETKSQADAAEQEEAPAATKEARGYYGGFWLSSGDGRYDLNMGGRITARFTALQPGHPLGNDFSVERARLFFNAYLLDHYDLRIQVEFSPDPSLKDAYLGVNPVTWAKFRVGQFKVPFSLEVAQSHKYIDFAERSIAVFNIFRPSIRDIGIMLWGSVGGGVAEYQLSGLNGAGENRRDNNGDKDLAGRLVVRPFRKAPKSAFFGTHLGVSGTWGDQDADLSNVDFTTVGRTAFVQFAPGTALEGNRSRLGAEFALPLGPALLKAESIWMWMDNVRRLSVREDLDFHSWYVSGSYLLTGESKTLGRMVPEHPLSLAHGTWGAWELAARFSRFDSDEALFRQGMASGTTRTDAVAAGLNWYINELLRLTLNYEYADFKDQLVIDGEPLDDEHAVLVQGQLEF